ncbi:hypothetical protein EST38_g10490 [Candolleomyces aberdarensis]|uniref:Histone-lysine N-methyltransferase SET5 n=1 Tax=Candolleomyces aberdarensis TaxID=2316362 RepID=A0A4Q2DA54_9AGAR|nr:hypothetical protein EST38_g10490 [Candolleomyces aberdarensis]
MSITPAEDVLTSALVELKAQNPSLGITKIHALLLKQHPDWAVSEKRTKKILKMEGLTSSAIPPDPNVVYPTSRLVPTLDVNKWTTKVRVKMFDKRKGKGLVATTDIQEGEMVWKEDPFVIAAEWDIYDLQVTGQASRSAKVHPLLCQAQNPACAPLVKFIREREWMALNALTHCVSRVLLANQYDEATLRADWDVMKGLAALGMEERAKYSFNQAEPDRATWKKAHQLIVQAFKEPKNPADQKKLAKLLKKPLPLEVDQEFFEYDPGFLKNLGKMSLNLEAHGGLYTLHSHLNHSCAPNCSARHNEKRTALSRISIIAKRPIAPGEELTVTYVNPELPYRSRQDELQAWGFGSCKCDRCVGEEKTFQLKDVLEDGQPDMHDLERELKAGLGVM